MRTLRTAVSTAALRTLRTAVPAALRGTVTAALRGTVTAATLRRVSAARRCVAATTVAAGIITARGRAAAREANEDDGESDPEDRDRRVDADAASDETYHGHDDAEEGQEKKLSLVPHRRLPARLHGVDRAHVRVDDEELRVHQTETEDHAGHDEEYVANHDGEQHQEERRQQLRELTRLREEIAELRRASARNGEPDRDETALEERLKAKPNEHEDCVHSPVHAGVRLDDARRDEAARDLPREPGHDCRQEIGSEQNAPAALEALEGEAEHFTDVPRLRTPAVILRPLLRGGCGLRCGVRIVVHG